MFWFAILVLILIVAVGAVYYKTSGGSRGGRFGLGRRNAGEVQDSAAVPTTTRSALDTAISLSATVVDAANAAAIRSRVVKKEL